MENKKKIGIMGGTFNPIHIGHLILAEQAHETFQLEKVLFIPSKNPPHKCEINILSEFHRKEMVRLAIESNPYFELSTIELDREGVTYTVDTLLELTKNNPNSEYYFIVGGDSLFQFETWKNPEVIAKIVHIIAASRHSISVKEMETKICYLNQTYHGKFDLFRIPTIDLSSELIRSKIRNGFSVKYYLSESVLNYIEAYQLYKNEN